jgi:hypothetical protein
VRVVTVLRSGGDFGPAHVQALHRQIARWLPGTEVVCLSDRGPISGVHVEPLRFLWPGWWSKMEMFAPWIEGDLLFMDLDTVVVGPLDDIANIGRLTMLRDFYKPLRLGSGLMFIPEEPRGEVWSQWLPAWSHVMRTYRVQGDQAFLQQMWSGAPALWQDVLPGQVVSYKVDVRPTGEVPADARVVCFHGKPRPWALPPSHPIYQAAGY